MKSRRLRVSSRSKKFRSRAFKADARGAVQIEFVLSILTIMFVIFAMWELIMIVHTMNVLSDSAKEGVRYAIVHGAHNQNCSGPNPPPECTSPDLTASNVVNRVKEYAKYSLHDITAIAVTVTYPDSSIAAPSRVRVEVAYDFIPYTVLNYRPTLRAVAEGRIVF